MSEWWWCIQLIFLASFAIFLHCMHCSKGPLGPLGQETADVCRPKLLERQWVWTTMLYIHAKIHRVVCKIHAVHTCYVHNVISHATHTHLCICVCTYVNLCLSLYTYMICSLNLDVVPKTCYICKNNSCSYDNFGQYEV